jgi:hypothetical protein
MPLPTGYAYVAGFPVVQQYTEQKKDVTFDELAHSWRRHLGCLRFQSEGFWPLCSDRFDLFSMSAAGITSDSRWSILSSSPQSSYTARLACSRASGIGLRIFIVHLICPRQATCKGPERRGIEDCSLHLDPIGVFWTRHSVQSIARRVDMIGFS